MNLTWKVVYHYVALSVNLEMIAETPGFTRSLTFTAVLTVCLVALTRSITQA